MPVKKKSGSNCYTWGRAGQKTCLSKKKAEAVGKAAYANGYRGKKNGK